VILVGVLQARSSQHGSIPRGPARRLPDAVWISTALQTEVPTNADRGAYLSSVSISALLASASSVTSDNAEEAYLNGGCWDLMEK
jgi:hypothetical protein